MMLAKRHILRSWVIALAATTVLSACSDDTDFDFAASQAQEQALAQQLSPPQALFSPADQVVPFPSNLLFIGSDDGTLNIPLPAEQQVLSNPQFVLGQQDGFSTTTPIVTPLSKPLDPETLEIGRTVRVFEVTTPPGASAAERVNRSVAITGAIAEIDPTSMIVSQVEGQLVLIPVRPLMPSTSYMVALVNDTADNAAGITDTTGEMLQASTTYSLLQGETVLNDPAAEGLRQAVASHSQVMNLQLGINPQDVVLSWVFTTQSTREVLQSVKNISNTGANLTLSSANFATNAQGINLQGKANVYQGSITLPYYQTVVAEDGNPAPALNGFWNNAGGKAPGASDDSGQPDYTPVSTTDVTVPVLMTVPNETSAAGPMPASGWPVTIFQHGITGNRTIMLAIADAMADVGRAVVAIDMPMHGLTDSSNPLHANNNPRQPTERTFDIDVLGVDPETGAPSTGPDGEIDASGSHFYNLANLANSRDNLRQAVADLFVLTANIGSAQFDDNTMLDASNLTFVGHSLGGIVGITMLAFEDSFQAATLGMPGGGIAQLLANSESFGPIINGGLAANGVATGSPEYVRFLSVAQTMIDSADPVNHAATVATGNTRLHLIEVLNDATVPNFVPTAALSGTEPLIALMNLPPVATSVSDSNAAVRFSAGGHGSLVGSPESAAATIEMQSQMASFAQSQGGSLTVQDTSVLQAVPEGQ